MCGHTPYHPLPDPFAGAQIAGDWSWSLLCAMQVPFHCAIALPHLYSHWVHFPWKEIAASEGFKRGIRSPVCFCSCTKCQTLARASLKEVAPPESLELGTVAAIWDLLLKYFSILDSELFSDGGNFPVFRWKHCSNTDLRAPSFLMAFSLGTSVPGYFHRWNICIHERHSAPDGISAYMRNSQPLMEQLHVLTVEKENSDCIYMPISHKDQLYKNLSRK